MDIQLDDYDEDEDDEHLTVDDALVDAQQHFFSDLCDEYMIDMRLAFQQVKQLQKDAKEWPIVSHPNARIKVYSKCDNDGFVRIRGRLKCDRHDKILIMERDYCFEQRRSQWDKLSYDVKQIQEYDCRGMGTLRLVEQVSALPGWAHTVSRRRALGLEWDRRLVNSSTLIFKTVACPPNMEQALTPNCIDVDCVLGIYVRTIDDEYCHVDYLLKVSAPSFVEAYLFKRFYVEQLEKRILKYEHVLNHWDRYYPDNGRVIR